MTQVCSSLAEAHAAGLIHRDIKPANIMINRRGGIYDFVKLLDFGLVKALDGPRQSSATAQGLTGTPLYMSPEAIERSWTVDARSDIYALGAVGYFLLTGKPVFEGDNIVEICMRHVDTPPVPPACGCGSRSRRTWNRSSCVAWPNRPPTGRSRPRSCGGFWSGPWCRRVGPTKTRPPGGTA